jgi:hypothetical protein
MTPADIRSTQFYQDAVTESMEVVSKRQRDLVMDDWFLRRCESPLEAAWRVWWHVVLSGCSHAASGRRPHATFQHDTVADGRRYRLDVAIHDWNDDGTLKPILAVELDGHTYHERTPTQVAERNARDRALQMAGWTVLHFSYEEIRTRGLDCAIEVFERFGAMTMPSEMSA